ncbi:hypothetical protein JI739_05070 [Ramlibacter sp. AW1]|uniref:Uncharacterized protein n=1 Tax=Ramlibacter aurantiacus TaxID=2801330 RepID=A0A936ZL63_9BURK|nr:hypothetical protein [Ramlibacter aurantiacus]MBL0419716.1 hypothetical protein [Ramlibacter aurantiacus]
MAQSATDSLAVSAASVELLERLHRDARTLQPRAWVGLWVDLGEAAARWDPHLHAYDNPLDFSTFLQIAIDSAESRRASGPDARKWLAASGSELALRLGPREAPRRQFELAVAHCKHDLDERHQAPIDTLASGFRAAIAPPAQEAPGAQPG